MKTIFQTIKPNHDLDHVPFPAFSTGHVFGLRSVSKRVFVRKTIHTKILPACRSIFMQIKLIVIRKVLCEDSF